MGSVPDIVETVTKFFSRILPRAREGGPFTKGDIIRMFEIAQYCQKLCESAQLPSVYKSVIEQLGEVSDRQC